MRPATKRVIRKLGYKNYTAYLRSAHWLRVRTAYAKSRRRKTCYVCRSKKVVLHHISYDHLGDEQNHLEDLVPLCKTHHRAVHNYMKHHRCPVATAHVKYKAHIGK